MNAGFLPTVPKKGEDESGSCGVFDKTLKADGESLTIETWRLLTWPMAKRLKLFGITYLVGKIKFELFFQGPLAE